MRHNVCCHKEAFLLKFEMLIGNISFVELFIFFLWFVVIANNWKSVHFDNKHLSNRLIIQLYDLYCTSWTPQLITLKQHRKQHLPIYSWLYWWILLFNLIHSSNVLSGYLVMVTALPSIWGLNRKRVKGIKAGRG